MQYLKPLFDIQRVHENGSSLHYELHYKQGNQYKPVVNTKFETLRQAEKYRDKLLELGE